jgi:hypothetical protein
MAVAQSQDVCAGPFTGGRRLLVARPGWCRAGEQVTKSIDARQDLADGEHQLIWVSSTRWIRSAVDSRGRRVRLKGRVWRPSHVQQLAVARSCTCKAQSRTSLCRTVLEHIGLALAGGAGSRLAALLGFVAGRSTKLRLVHALPDPEVGMVGACNPPSQRKRMFDRPAAGMCCGSGCVGPPVVGLG